MALDAQDRHEIVVSQVPDPMHFQHWIVRDVTQPSAELERGYLAVEDRAFNSRAILTEIDVAELRRVGPLHLLSIGVEGLRSPGIVRVVDVRHDGIVWAIHDQALVDRVGFLVRIPLGPELTAGRADGRNPDVDRARRKALPR